MNRRFAHMNTEYVRRSKAKALAAGKCASCFEPREPERAGKTRCKGCAKVDAMKQRLRNARAA